MPNPWITFPTLPFPIPEPVLPVPPADPAPPVGIVKDNLDRLEREVNAPLLQSAKDEYSSAEDELKKNQAEKAELQRRLKLNGTEESYLFQDVVDAEDHWNDELRLAEVRREFVRHGVGVDNFKTAPEYGRLGLEQSLIDAIQGNTHYPLSPNTAEVFVLPYSVWAYFAKEGGMLRDYDTTNVTKMTLAQFKATL